MAKTPKLETYLTWDELMESADKQIAGRKLRKERPWTRDIIRVLSRRRPWLSMSHLTKELWALRNPSGLPMPKNFTETVQSALNQHTSQSSRFSGKPEDDLFYSPEGKGSGTWTIHRERADAWLEAHKLPPA
jgi:hypothetical protein